MLYPIIDIGSASIRMAIYKIQGDSLKLIHKKKHTVGLAAYVKNEVMTEAGITKASEILLEFKELLQALKINKPVAFTTAALRNCKNSEAAVKKIIANTGIELHIISGDQEAWYDFIAITHGLKYNSGFIMDIGGASTELIHFVDNKVREKISLPIGSLLLHTNFVENIFPNEVEVGNMAKFVQSHFQAISKFAHSNVAEICGIGGSFKGMHLLYKAVKGEEQEQIPRREIKGLLDYFVSNQAVFSEADIIKLLTAVPDRLKTIFPGIIIANELAEFLGVETITYKDAGMREGFIYAHLLNK